MRANVPRGCFFFQCNVIADVSRCRWKRDKGGTERKTKGNCELLIAPTQRAGIFIASSWFTALPGRALPVGGRPDVVSWS